MKALTVKTLKALKTLKPLKTSNLFVSHCFVLTALLSASSYSLAAPLAVAIDDFSDAKVNSLGIERQYISDAVAGGATTTAPTLSEGILYLKGQILPPRGQPGWASAVLPLGPEGEAQDASQFQGVRMLIKVNTGTISLTANSTEITNFDYHAMPIAVASDGQFHEVKIPFNRMKRAWSEQTPLNPKTIHSLSIVAFSPQQGAFDYAIDEVSFY